MQGDASLSVDIEGGWGSNGPFAWSVWVQQTSNTGDLHQYVVSTRSNATGYLINNTIDVYQPDEVKAPSLIPPLPLYLHALHSGGLAQVWQDLSRSSLL